ncbi:DUF166 domain-containing protein [Methanosalsum natronophilum]|uniref:DUF166 domain-containing protein n=1 Tax=Methanosalsum natronophilum TaxID=768733 RepID=UPI0021684EF2|nr:DUF166 domain-containing protein [Methanosalsum natronophilum]
MFVFYSGDFGQKVISNLVNLTTFCVSCGELCDKCRIRRPSLAENIVGIHEFDSNLPEFIEDPESYYPQNLPTCDLILAIDLHPDLVSALPKIAQKMNSSAVIVPVEQHKLGPPGLLDKVKEELESIGIEYESPRPFCSLSVCGKPVIDEFVRMGFGRPSLRIKLNETGDIVTAVDVMTDAPCGSTCYVARKLRGSSVSDYKATVSSAHHAYPCTAGMEIDPVIGDTLLHWAGYIIRDSVEKALKKTKS